MRNGPYLVACLMLDALVGSTMNTSIYVYRIGSSLSNELRDPLETIFDDGIVHILC